MTANGNGRSGTIAGVFKDILGSPVGGWALAVILVAGMAYFTFKDRQVMYQDLVHLRESAMPLIQETKRVTEDAQALTEENNKILNEIRSYMNIPLENRSDLKKVLKEIQQLPKQGEVDNINH